MNISFFFNARDTMPLNSGIGWHELCELLQFTANCHWQRSRKLDFPAMIFGECKGRRANANIRHLSGLAADFDIGPDDPRYVGFDAMCHRLEREGYAFAAYTTTKNDARHNHFRLVMPYGCDVDVSLCEAAWHACNAKFDGTIDPSTKDPARLSFLPAHWTENPFTDSKGVVTLCEPFNAVRVNVTGKPILSATEITALAAMPLTSTNGRTRASSQCYSPTPVLSGAEREAVARGKSAHDPAWRILGDLHRSPLVTPWLLNDLPGQPGSRDHRFMTTVACNAIRKSLPITADVIASLAEQFSRERLNREPPPDVARQAENALAWAFRSSVDGMEPRQPDAGT